MFLLLRKVSSFVVGQFERFFFWYGRLVSRNPWWAILGCMVLAGTSGIGLINYTTENNAFKLWIPDNSVFLNNYQYLQENFPPDIRYNNLIISSEDNILTPEVIKMLYNLRLDILKLETSDAKNWTQLCKTVPKINSPFRLKKPNCSSPFGFGNILCGVDLYCSIYEQISEEVCFETGILELWGYDDPAVYDDLTTESILEKINESPLMSVPFGREIADIESYVSVTRDDTSERIIGGKALSTSWFGKVNTSRITEDDLSESGTGLPADPTTLEFEELLKKKFEEYQSKFQSETNSDAYINVARSYEDVAGETIMNDAVLMPAGFTMVFVYIMIMLGKFDCVHTRAFLSVVGVASIGLTILVTYGLCSAFGLFFGPMHNVIPFLFLGIGIDDMFVIMQCYDNLLPSEKRVGDDPYNIGMAMKHAGTAITITSLTDIVVFGVGASTTLPALRSFCLYCALGMTAVYFFQATFFVACLAIDQRRIRQQRNGLLPCFKHKIDEPVNEDKEELDVSDSSHSISGKIFKKIGEALINPFIRIFVIVATFLMLGFGIWGVTLLETKFESEWFLPPESYLRKWFDASEKFFPTDGVQVTVYMPDLEFRSELGKIENLLQKFDDSRDIIKSYESWYPTMKTYFNEEIGLTDEGGIGIPNVNLTEAEFNNYTSLFLFSKEGARFSPNFITKPELKCGDSFDKIMLSTFTFTHQRFSGPSEHIPAMHKVQDMIAEEKFSQNVFALSIDYSNWETDEVIDNELYRNLGISMACVFATTLLLLADVVASIEVMICVLMTLVNVMGYMHFWGLTIDVVSSIVVIISIGLCVDYSAHIAHTFLTSRGSRSERAAATVQHIGPAVLNGGFSTFLALLLLVTSKSHVFSSFFKVFFLVVTFGLYHGLIFFPAFLSLLGPRSYHTEIKSEKTKENSQKQTTL